MLVKAELHEMDFVVDMHEKIMQFGDEELIDVYSRLEDTINKGKFTIIIGHSLGGGLTLKYFSDNKKSIKKFSKIILLMPFITTDYPLTIISYIPFLNRISLPKGLIIPNSNLYDDGNILNDTFNFVSGKQLTTMVLDFIPKLDLSLLESANFSLISATDDKTGGYMNENTLSKINNKIVLEGKHQMFMDFDKCKEFFKTIKTILK